MVYLYREIKINFDRIIKVIKENFKYILSEPNLKSLDNVSI